PGGRWQTLLDPAYLRERAGLIGPQTMKTVEAGRPAGPAATAWAPAPVQPERGTTHLSVVDREGRAVALTSSVEASFGARRLAAGFLLNSQLTDFALQPTGPDGRPVANRVEPGKRPRSSMSPTMVFDRDTGRLELVTGSPGGAMIIPFVVKALWAGLAEGDTPQAAADRPNVGVGFAPPGASGPAPVLLETGRFDAATQAALRSRGHVLREMSLPSGLATLQRQGRGWAAGADPRREGVAAGE
ncbi:MAG: gamma-glutamyltransferase, partial [Rubrivivax sp.]